MGKLVLYPQDFFYPTFVLSGYNTCAMRFLDAKLMILQALTDLSTKKHAFTITTIFIYIPYIKELYSAVQWIFPSRQAENLQKQRAKA